MTIEGLALTPGNVNNARATEEISNYLRTAGEFSQFLASTHDNIPFDAVASPCEYVPWTLNTIQVKGATVKRRNGVVTAHSVYIHPPTIKPEAYKKWIKLLHGISYETCNGVGKAVVPDICIFWKSIGHASPECIYPSIAGWPVRAPPSAPGSGRGRGYGRGRGAPHFTRGHGSGAMPWA
ncbi:hypothetical protein M422DRAFT_267293 [Sphaerobolus stellatus SS14]|uniref:Uncharacterized protein n=1 Tax=Sphaerobolus stellatus (strain SS14) TaxID=990650 RepID=A0A0C9UPY4_SPHS4|nr:hypothetical protein M422DRAFT_267293 [Sphaerobolus stellatus SS14]